MDNFSNNDQINNQTNNLNNMNPNPNQNSNQSQNLNQNQNMNKNTDPDSVDNLGTSHVNPANYVPNSNLDIKGSPKNLGSFANSKPKKSGTVVLGIILSLIALALSGFLVYMFLTQNKKIDKLNASINQVTTKVDNKLLDMDKKLRSYEDMKKEYEKNKKDKEVTDEKENNKKSYMAVAENVLNEIGRDYKKEPKEFNNEDGKLDQKKFENKFLNNREISKMKSEGKWESKTQGATIRFIYTFNNEKDKENNFYLDLTLKSGGDYEVKPTKGSLNSETKEASETNGENKVEDGANNE